MRAKNWCFTLNNYTAEQKAKLQCMNSETTGIQYMVAGDEVAGTGTPHLQGYVQFQSRKTLNQVKQIIGDCHLSVTKYIDRSILYCKKDGDYFELGTVNSVAKQGHRNELEEFKLAVKGGSRKRKDLRETHSDVAARYPKFFNDYINDNVPPPEPENHVLRPWQENLKTILDGDTNDRSIIFVVDTTGNEGKSWFAHQYETSHDNVQVMVPGKKADMAYTLIEEPYCLILDCPRSKQGDFIQYDFLEEVKNGYVFSAKYESRVKRFKPPHVVCMMNEQPDMTKLSADRYHVIMLDDHSSMLI